MTPSTDKLLDAARAVRARSYSPYSGFAVGAAIETEDGTVVTGCNVETASLSLTICAERVALSRAIAEGHRRFRAIAIAGAEGVDTPPCGACRQFMAEFARDLPVTFTSANGIERTTISQLLPRAFTAESLR
jgi:cytidine deaminase